MENSLNFIESLSIDVNINNKLLDKINTDYKSINYKFKIDKIKLKKKNSINQETNLNKIFTKLNEKFNIEEKDNDDCSNFWQENMLNNVKSGVFISDELKSYILKKINYNLKLSWYSEDESLYGYYDILFENVDELFNFLDKLENLIKVSIFIYKNLNIYKDNDKIKEIFFLTNKKG